MLARVSIQTAACCSDHTLSDTRSFLFLDMGYFSTAHRLRERLQHGLRLLGNRSSSANQPPIKIRVALNIWEKYLARIVLLQFTGGRERKNRRLVLIDMPFSRPKIVKMDVPLMSSCVAAG
jgi:hypothetical protein